MTIESIAQSIAQNGIWILLLLVALENLGIPGYPGGFTLPAIGVLSRVGMINPVTGFVVALVASSVTMLAVYLVGLKCGGWASSKLSKSEKFRNGYTKMKELIEKYGNPAVFIARIVPFVRVFVSITAGLLGMNWRGYCVYSLLGNLVYTVVAMGLGYFATAIIV